MWWKQVSRGLWKVKCLFPYFPLLHLLPTLPKSLPWVSAQAGSCLLHERKVEQPRFCMDSKILGGLTVLTALNLITPDHNTQRQEGKIRNNAHSGSSLLFPPKRAGAYCSPAKAWLWCLHRVLLASSPPPAKVTLHPSNQLALPYR